MSYKLLLEKLMDTFISNLITTALHDQVQKLSVGAAIVHEGKILILKRCPDDFMPNIYELPGGGIEMGESLLDALKREIVEETSCEVDKIVGYLGHIDFPSSTGLLTRRFNFLIEPKLPVIVQLTEHTDYKWILPADADQYDITAQTRNIIALVRDGIVHYF